MIENTYSMWYTTWYYVMLIVYVVRRIRLLAFNYAEC
jgi:hypothetical protein